jgi:chromosome segregation ATPase
MSWTWRKPRQRVEPTPSWRAPNDLVADYAARGVRIAELEGRFTAAEREIGRLRDHNRDVTDRLRPVLAEKARVLGELDGVNRQLLEAGATIWQQKGQIEDQARQIEGLTKDLGAERDNGRAQSKLIAVQNEKLTRLELSEVGQLVAQVESLRSSVKRLEEQAERDRLEIERLEAERAQPGSGRYREVWP